MKKKTVEKIVLALGLILIIVGMIIMVSAIPTVQQSIWPYENAVTELAEKVPPISATRIIVGVIVMVAGFILLFKNNLNTRRK